MSGPKVTVTGLGVSLGGREVVRGADFVLEAGKLIMLVGPNGAGKTTILRALAGLPPRQALRAERRQRFGNRGHREFVLTQVLAGRHQRLREAGGVLVRGAAADGSGQHT